MGANRRLRPAPVAHVAPETIVSLGKKPGADPTTERAFDAIQRITDQLRDGAEKAATHPTLRDAVIEQRLASGDNEVKHGLGRRPRFVYLCIIDVAPKGFLWAWSRRDGDADRNSVVVSLEGTVPASTESGGVIVTGGVRCLVRVE